MLALRLRRAAYVVAFLLLGVVYTYPLVLHPLTTFPGGPHDTDVFGFLWNNWWIRHAILALHARPDRTAFIFAPFGVDLRLHTLGLLYGVASIPFLPALGTIGVLSLQTLATPALNGYAAYRLAAYVSKQDQAGLVAGLLVAGSPAINFHLAVGRPSCAAVWPICWALLALLRLIESPTPAQAGQLSLAVIVMLLVDQQIALFGLCWLSVMGIVAISRGRLTRRLTLYLAAAAVLPVVAGIWFYWLPLTQLGGYTTPSATESLRYSLPISLLWTPGLIWRVFGALLPAMLIVACWRARGDREIVIWIAASMAFMVLTFGPSALGGRIPLPFGLLRWLPAFDQFRTPYRFQIPTALGLSVVTALVLAPVIRRRPVIALALVCCAIDVVAYRLAYPVAVQAMSIQPVYSIIARDPRDMVVLEVPVGVRTGTDRIGEGEILTFYQSQHGKRLINGFAARGPLAALAYYRQSPALMFLAHEATPPGDIDRDLRLLMRELAVGYVVVHTDRMDPKWSAQVLELLERMNGLQAIDTGRPETVAYRIGE